MNLPRNLADAWNGRARTVRDRADRLNPNIIVFSKRDSYQRRGHLTVSKVESCRLTLPRTRTSRNPSQRAMKGGVRNKDLNRWNEITKVERNHPKWNEIT